MKNGVKGQREKLTKYTLHLQGDNATFQGKADLRQKCSCYNMCLKIWMKEIGILTLLNLEEYC